MAGKNGNVSASPWNLSPDELRQLHQSDATVRWLCDLPDDLLQQLAGKWVAAKDCAIVAAADTYEGLFRALAGVELSTVVIHRIERAGPVIYGTGSMSV